MKLKVSISAIALLGLMALVPTVSHANETAAQPATRVLTEQEMQEVTGAGKSCNYTEPGCGSTCSFPQAGFVFKDKARRYTVCGSSFGWDTCSNNTYVRCAEWTSWAVTDPLACSDAGGSFIRNSTTLGCI